MKDKYRKNNKTYTKFNHSKKPSIKSKLQDAQTWAYKKFGQNFLMDKIYIDYMINGLDIQEKDFIIEIGPGMGALTEAIIAKSKIKSKNEDIADLNYLCIEIDIEKLAFLSTEFPGIKIENISILDFDIEAYLTEHNISSYKVIGSLPYNISKKIVQKFSETNIRPEKAVFMVQKEVGEDYVVNVQRGSSFLAMYLSQFWSVVDHIVVPALAFFPAPKVDGMVMVLKPTSGLDRKFIRFVKMGYSSPRKKVGNVLSLDKEHPAYNKRPHELNSDEWKKLYYERYPEAIS